MVSRNVRFGTLLWKTVVVHTVTYFLAGLVAMTLFDYARVFAEEGLRGFMRGTDEPLVMAGPLFQPLRGVLFALAFYPLRGVLFGKARGWLVTWLMLVTVGIFSTFGPAPGSLEGFIYTTVPVGRQLGGLIEVLAQSCLLSWVLYAWVNHPGNRWLTWGLNVAFAVVMLLPTLGLLARAFLPGA